MHPTLRTHLKSTLAHAVGWREESALRTMANSPSALWVDSKSKIRGSTLDTLEGVLRNASVKGQLCVVVLCACSAPH